MHNRRAPATAAAAALAAPGLACAAPAQAAEYSSALKVKGVQYDAPGRDSDKCAGGNTGSEYLTVENYSRTAAVDRKGYTVKDAGGRKSAFGANHYPQPGDQVSLRGGHRADSDARNVAYRQSRDFPWNDDQDTIYLYKPSGARADVHGYTRGANDRDGNGHVTYHG